MQGDRELRNAQRQLVQAEGLSMGLQPHKFRAVQPRGRGAQARLRDSYAGGAKKAKVSMLMGIGSWGSGEEVDNGNDWEVAMGLNKGSESLSS